MNSQKPKSEVSLFLSKKLVPILGWAVGLIAIALLFNWGRHAIAPQPQPAIANTPLSGVETNANAPIAQTYERRGTTLTLSQPLPGSPSEASVFLAQPERRATIESARTLADQFSMQGEIYEMPAEIGDKTDFLIVDGDQRLIIRSDRYFTYYPNYPVWNYDFIKVDNPNVEELIGDFMQTVGFDFEYKIEPSGLYSRYYVFPLAPDGIALHYDYFKASGLLFRFDNTGIISVEASLMNYDPVGKYGIITAEEALQKYLDSNATVGLIEGMHSSAKPAQAWHRYYPKDQTVTIFGWMNSVKSLEGGSPLVTLDNYTVIGDLAGINETTANTFIEATGQFHAEDNADVFVLESWKVYDGYDEGYQGTLQREGEEIVLITMENQKLILPDVPPDVPLPLENVYVMGVTRGDTFEWKSFDMRMTEGGGGGGGGGIGFYKLNLTGTPMPLPTPQQELNQGTGEYVVQENDTRDSIAESYGMTTDELMWSNGLSEEIVFVGQILTIPSTRSGPQPGQRIEGQRGLLNVTLYNQPDGSQRAEYIVYFNPDRQPYSYGILLEGTNLTALQAYQNRPVEIWGTIDRYDDQRGVYVVNVERFEIPFPDLQVQILRGTQKIIELQGQPATLFTADDGEAYVQMGPSGGLDSSLIGVEGDQVLLEALAIPHETFGGYATLRVFSAAMAIDPQDGQLFDLAITADQPYVTDEPTADELLDQESYVPPTATIEKVELVYYISNPRYAIPDPNADPAYIQPMWRFYGHYSNGDEFEVLIQALQDEFLSPEIQVVEGPG